MDDGSQARQAASLVVHIATWLRDEEARACGPERTKRQIGAQSTQLGVLAGYGLLRLPRLFPPRTRLTEEAP